MLSQSKTRFVVFVVSSAAVFAMLAPAITAAPAPPFFWGVEVTGNRVVLDWTVPVGATAIRLQAGTAPGLSNVANVLLAAVPPRYIATGVPIGRYYVRLRASDSSGESAPSNEREVIVEGPGGTPCATAPDPPLLRSSGTEAAVFLDWQPALTGCPASTYILDVGSARGLSNVAVLNLGTTRSFATTVPSRVLFYMRARAQNAYGTSAASNEQTAYSDSSPCRATLPGTITGPGSISGCWLGSVSFGEGLIAPPGFCTGARYHFYFKLTQLLDGTVLGTSVSVLAEPAPSSVDCALTSQGIGTTWSAQIKGRVVGNTFTTTSPFAFAFYPIWESTLTATFTDTHLIGAFTVDREGVTGPGTLTLTRIGQ